MKAIHSRINRRQFMKVSLASGAGLLVACHLAPGGKPAEARKLVSRGSFVPNAWLRIAADDTVTVISKHTELGQGTYTGLAMIVAEELAADWSKMRTEIAPVAPVYKNPDIGVMATGGSTGIKTSWEAMRKAGAATREMLIAAAAATWKVPASQCRAENSMVIHQPTKRRLRYGELIQAAADQPVPQNPVLKDPGQFKVVGQPYGRLDSADKARGKTVYGIDIKLPGLLTAAMIHAPVLGGKPLSVDDHKARAMPGVKGVVVLDSSVAVVAETYWQARNAADTLNIRWKDGQNDLSSQGIMAGFAARIGEKGVQVRNDGNVKAALKNAAQRIEAVYELPYQAHLCPEPMNCTAHVRPDGCELWAPSQSQQVARDIAAHITGLPLDAVKVNTPFVGGGFGLRGRQEFVTEAVQLSMRLKAPVKVIWSREEDVKNDLFRPAGYNHIEAGLDQNGYPVAWVHKAVGQSELEHLIEVSGPSFLPQWIPLSARFALGKLIVPIAKRMMGPEGAMSGSFDMNYEIENIQVRYVRSRVPVPVGSWRSVGDSCNAFVKESFIDEIAAASGKDPVDLRLALLKDVPRERNVLELAVKKAGWGRSLPDGVFQGVALHTFHGTPVAMVAEVSVDQNGRVRVHRMVAAVDCGIVINPKLVRTQIQGGIIFGLGATLKSRIHIDKGQVQESNFDDFPIIYMAEAPRIEVHIVDSKKPPYGVGEPGVPPVAPAVTNAVFRATGIRIRRLPIDPGQLRQG